MSNKMLIDSSHPEETRVVVVKGNRLEEFDFESQHKHQIRGNIYLAKVTRVEPSLQAAFVDYGGNRHGFLAFSEIHPDYYQIPLADRQALLEEEAALASEDAEDDDAAAEAATQQKSSKGRRRGRGRGRRNSSRGGATSTPEAELVAFDDILAAYEKRGDSIPAAIDGGEVISEDAAGAEANGSDDDDLESIAEAVDVVTDDDDAIEEVRPRRRSSRRQYKIQEVIKRRQVILVQVVKEERGNKGAALTTYMSLAGRYSVLMPNTARGGGISRKITNTSDRKRLKDMVKELEVPKGMGVILRTAGANRTGNEVKRDYEYLMRLWDTVRDLTLSSSAPALVYEEGNLIKRSIRDLFNKDIKEIVVAGEAAYREAKDFMSMLMPSSAKLVKPWKDSSPIFARTGMEAQLDKLMTPQVTLKSGGYIIINQTEALVAIDVNSGKSTREHSIEETAVATNLEAAEEVARQLRLRDLAGLIVVDFIDMEENRNNRAVEKKLKDCLKHDRARIQVGRISHFGLLEMSRQRMRASVLESTMKLCDHCAGTGLVRSAQSVALHVIRSIEEYLIKNDKNHITVRTSGETALYILNEKRASLLDMEDRFGLNIEIAIDDSVGTDMVEIDRGEVSNLPKRAVTHVTMDYEDSDADGDEAEVEAFASEDGESEHQPKKRRRRRRGGKSQDKQAGTDEGSDQSASGVATAGERSDSDGDNGDNRGKKRRRSRGRRGGRNRKGRYGRIPNVEIIGPMVEIVAAYDAANQNETPAPVARTEIAEQHAPEESVTQSEDVPGADETKTVDRSEPAPQTDAQVIEINVAPVEEADETTVEPALENGTAEDEKATRVRATASNINLDVEPVVVTASGDEKPKKKGGWWSR